MLPLPEKKRETNKQRNDRCSKGECKKKDEKMLFVYF